MPTKVKGNGVFHEVKPRLITKSLNDEIFNLANTISNVKKNNDKWSQKLLSAFLSNLKSKVT